MTIKRYADIVFMQGDDADAALDLLNLEGVDALGCHLSEWDYGEPGEIRDELPAGDGDYIGEWGEYIISWSWKYGYVGMSRVLECDCAYRPGDSGHEFMCWRR